MGQQRHPVIGLVVGHPGAEPAVMVGRHADGDPVPPDHLVDTVGLERHVVQDGVWRGLSAHPLSPLARRRGAAPQLGLKIVKNPPHTAHPP
jgi:hypothetical protein